MPDYLDYRTAPTPDGGFIGAKDLSGLTPGDDYRELFIFSYTQDGPQTGTVIVKRLADGSLSASTDVENYEPVLEGEQLVGMRFPGSDRYPVQPWDEERDG